MQQIKSAILYPNGPQISCASGQTSINTCYCQPRHSPVTHSLNLALLSYRKAIFGHIFFLRNRI